MSEAIKEGADVNEKVAGGDTPLLLAAKTGQSSSAQALIEAGADIKVRDDTGNGVLHYAAQSGMTGICGLLVDRGIADRRQGRGRRDAAAAGRRRAAGRKRPKYLVRRGASLEQKNDAALSALDIVERSGDTRFKNDLISAAKLRSN